jgi:predicted DCC family thiol-disulfide oxidoreductase YuxK
MPALSVIYDGKCGLCTASVVTLRRLDWLKRLDYLDANDVTLVQKRFHSLPTDNLLHEMHVVNPAGRFWTGYYGFRRLAWVLPLLWIVAPLLYLPGVPWIGSRVYRVVATNRARDLCDSDTCVAKRSNL